MDEAYRDPEFFAFRARLLVALQKKDTSFLYSIVADDIQNSFGGDGGTAEFRASWRPEEPTSKLWLTLTEILALGGQFQDRLGDGSKIFVAPYVFSVQPSAGSDPFQYGVVIGRSVKVRREPTPTSAALADLDFDVVRVTDWTPRPEASSSGGARTWFAVQLADGRSGFVASDFLRSRNDYRALFVFRQARWLLRALVAGD